MLLKFDYVNWRGEDHTYVIEPAPSGAQGVMHPCVDDTHDEYWMVSGDVVTRDGDPRPDMGPTRRRTFALVRMRNLEEVERSA